MLTLAYLISKWRLFTKMGEKGWVSLIPIYSTLVLTEKLLGNRLWFLLPTLGSVAVVVLSLLFKSIAVIGFAFVCAFIFILGYLIMMKVRLVQSFGKSGWWYVASILFPIPMNFIFGISELEYMDGAYALKDDFIECFINYYKGNWQDMPRPVIRKCKRCGATLRKGAAYCQNCGETNPLEDTGEKQ